MAEAKAPSPDSIMNRLNAWMKDRPTPPGFIGFHRWLYLRSGGRLGHGLVGAPSLVLTTTGRKTGQARESVLVYAPDGGDYVVAGSNYGGATDPAWLHNIRANPSVRVRVGRRDVAATATVVERSEPGHARLWDLMNAINHNRYDGYQARTSRPIAVAVISPDASAAG